ncbi:hypothetical protein [Porphyromonas endodontalis]|jgi:hypothetical protein|uniref:hypothetical protein n=1 Tax=Porphyromonas endodontalis TaxID=28124 RepID=UPI003FA0C9EB
MTVIVLGAGVDATEGIGMPLTNELIPKISEFIQTEEGASIERKLRSMIPSLRFHFDKFIKNTIDRIAQDFGREVVSIRDNIQEELRNNERLSEEDRKMGRLVMAIMNKVSSLKTGAVLDEETAQLIEELFGQTIRIDDETIVDFSKLVYTDTFKSVMRQIMERSLSHPNNAILKHVYHNLLDIEEILVKYFVGFYTGNIGSIKTYIYISWMLWSFLKEKEKEIYHTHSEDLCNNFPIYSQIPADWKIITFNYSSFAHFFAAARHDEDALYFHGNLMTHVDVYNKTELPINDVDYKDLNILSFFDEQLAPNLSFEDNNRKYMIPEFLPPMKIKPLLSRRFIKTWFGAEQVIKDADKIIIVGYSFNHSDEHFNGILRECRDKTVFIIDPDIEKVIKRIGAIYYYTPSMYNTINIQGHPAKKHDRVTLINAEAHEINIQEL